MRFPSNKTLGKITVYGAFAAITGVMWMRYKIEERIRKAEYFGLAFKALRQHRGAVSLLGEPIKEMGFDLSNDERNRSDGKTAQFEVNVKGSKDRGKIFFWATRSEEANAWLLDRLELEVKSQPDKRFLIKKPQVNNSGPFTDRSNEVESKSIQ